LIAGLGAGQALPYDQGIFPFEWDASRDAPKVGHTGDVLMATALLSLAYFPAGTVTSVQGATADVDGAATLWRMDFTSVVRAYEVVPDTLEVDTLTVKFVPEPGTLVLLGLGALATIRRRRP
jgi:hypothetical protein